MVTPLRRLTALLLGVAFIIQLTGAHGQPVDVLPPNRYTLIPRPAQLEPRAGAFILNRTTTIQVPFAQAALKAIADTFAHQIYRSTGLNIALQNASGSASHGYVIQFRPIQDTTLGKEGYRIDATTERVLIEAAGPNGFFYAVQTLYQLLPPAVLATKSPVPASGLATLPIPACRIEDRPRYSYRGMHLDVCRHFFSVAFVKRYIDLLALHKFNSFHWHLTDDQGWRIEIKRYPKLTEIGSHRRQTLVGHYNDYDPQVFDGKSYGGFYTQDEIREVVRYAATKYINVIPEIELPGHALAALAAYPELGCPTEGATTRPYQVATKWGVFDQVFCPTEQTFAFLQNVLSEVMDLFPGKYIHIGGDECLKTSWRKSPFCQELIQRKGLKNENGLQRYFISRIDAFVSAQGRRIIGWDEILEGSSPATPLAPNATVMSWRSMKGGIEAARHHHDVIMTPSPFCYFDYYQGDPAQEPAAFGGLLPLEKVYSFNPTPTDLSPAEAAHILGTQGNVWTEYIQTPEQAEYMIWPRAVAIAEVEWTALDKKNYDDFIRRLSAHFERLTNLNVNYARTIYDAQITSTPTADGRVIVTLTPGSARLADNQDVRYTVDGSLPSGQSLLYEKPFVLSQSATVRVATFQGPTPLSELAKVQTEFLVSKATGKGYTLLNAPANGRSKRFDLTNGTTGSVAGYEAAHVVAFASDLHAVLDLGRPQSVESVRIGFLKYTARNICLPRQVEIAVSTDGKRFTSVLTAKTNAAEGGKRAIVRLPFDFTPTTARYLRIISRTVGQVPAGLRNPGKAAQLAVDEIEVN